MADPAPVPHYLVFADDWGRHPSSSQHLFRQLLDHSEVYWVNTIGTRAPRFDLATLRRGLEKVRHWALGDRSRDDRPPGRQVRSPWMWPWFTTGLDRRLNGALLLHQLKRLTRALPAPLVAVTTLPIVADLVGRLPVARWAYYCVDDFTAWPGLDHEALRRMEEVLVRRADVVIAASDMLRARLAGMGRDAHLLTHGVDLGHWQGAAGGSADPPELAGLERPVMLFWGVIDRRMDTAWVKALAGGLSRGSVVLVGPRADPDPDLLRTPRVVWRPPVAYDRLPALARAADVLIMPYTDAAVTRAMQPLKLKEYLATGLPVVARDLPATRDWADCLDLASTAEGFSQAVRARLETGALPGQRQARERLAGEDWAAKARSLERWLVEEVPHPPERGGVYVWATRRDTRLQGTSGREGEPPVVLDVRVVTGAGGGPDKTILNSPRFLSKAGYRMLCAYMRPPGDPGFDELRRKAERWQAPLRSVPDRGPWDVRVLAHLLHLCRRERVAIWHGHDYKSNLLGLLLARRWPMRLVTTVQGWVERTWRTPLYFAVDRLCLPFYEAVLCVSEDLRERCLAAGVRAGRCVLVENAIEESFTRRREARAAKARCR